MSWTLGVLGCPKQARQQSREAVALAHKVSHPLSQAMALVYAGFLCAFYRDWPAAQEMAEASIKLCTKHQFLYYLGGGFFCECWRMAEQGQTEEAIPQLLDGISAARASGVEVLLGLQLCILAEAYRLSEQVEEGLAAVTEALATIDRTGERFYEAEVYRIQGELLLRAEGRRLRDESPEDCFLRAIEVARAQQAKLWELRAVMSLCRLRQKQEREKEAQQMLAEIYEWFTEGFDTPDLQDAKSLLDELLA
jgi:predicted ATPase